MPLLMELNLKRKKSAFKNKTLYSIEFLGRVFCVAAIFSVKIQADTSIDPLSVMTESNRGTELYLAVVLNGVDAGIEKFIQRGNGLSTSVNTLSKLGFKLPDANCEMVNLSDLKYLRVNLDTAQQEIKLDAPQSMLHLSVANLNTVTQEKPVANASTGMLLNYNFYGSHEQNGITSLNGFAELRAFQRNSVLSSTGLFSNHYPGSFEQDGFIRMDTSWSWSSPEEKTTLRVGDTLTSALSWSRSTRIGGIQYGTNYALQPYFVTAPLTSFIGAATLPSEVELYVNGIRQYSDDLPPGPFRLTTLPSVTGAGNAQVVLKNVLGQTTTFDFPVYGATSQLLGEGISDWSLELGFVRKDYGIDSAKYGSDPAASGTLRRGLTNQFTLETHEEVTPGLLNGGIGGSWLLNHAIGGVITGSLAASRQGSRKGEQYQLGYSWSNPLFHFSTRGLFSSSGYRDTAALYGATYPRSSSQTMVGYNFNSAGSVNLGYTTLSSELDTLRYFSASWFRSFSPLLSTSLSLSKNISNSKDYAVFITLDVALSRSANFTSSWQQKQNQSRVVERITESPLTDGGFGFQADFAQGAGTSDFSGRANYLGQYGLAEIGASKLNGNSYGYSSVAGSLVMMGKEIFASRQITNGFAVVSTNGVPDIPVMLSNNIVGTTDRNGMLLVTALNAYQNNKISIDPMNLPSDMYMAKTDMIAVPTDRAGTLVTFDVTQRHSAVVILIGEDGKPLSVGSLVYLAGGNAEPVIVGYGGETYFPDVSINNKLTAETLHGKCRASFVINKQQHDIPQIGPLICRNIE